MGTVHVTLSEMQFKTCSKAEQMPSGVCPSGKDYLAIASSNATELIPTYGLLFILGALAAEIAIIYYTVALHDGVGRSGARAQCHFAVVYVPPESRSLKALVPFVGKGFERAMTVSKMELAERADVLGKLVEVSAIHAVEESVADENVGQGEGEGAGAAAE